MPSRNDEGHPEAQPIQSGHMKPLLVAFALLIAVAPAFAHPVVGISDGDTLTLLVDGKPLKIRLANIDAPEKHQVFGEVSRQSLSALCFGQDADTGT